MGPRVGLNFWRANFNPIDGSIGPNYNDLSFDIGIVPRISYNLSDRLSLDFSVPLMYKTSYRFGSEYDPYGFAYNGMMNYNGISSRFTANARFGLTLKLFK